MPLPNIIEFIGTNITQRKFQEAQEKLLNYLGIEVPTKTELNSEISKLNNAITPKADKIYVDSALSSFQNGALKTYPTLAAANADIANIPLNTKVSVLSETEGGDYYKATAGATSLTKSPYEPLAQAKSFTKDSTDIFDVSANSNNYNLTFADAIAAVPTELRKQNLTVRYNNADERTFVNSNLTNWTNQRYWIRKINTVSENKINHFDERMIYNGFVIGGDNTLNVCAIIPIHRTYTDGVENKLTIRAYPNALSPVTWGFLRSDGTTLGALTNISELSGYTIPVGAAYVYINLETNNGTSVVGAGNVEIAKKGLRYFPDNTAPTVSNPSYQDGFDVVNYGIKTPIYEDRTPQGTEFVSPFFKGGLASYRGVHIAQIVKHVEIQKRTTRPDCCINWVTSQIYHYSNHKVSRW